VSETINEGATVINIQRPICPRRILTQRKNVECNVDTTRGAGIEKNDLLIDM